MPKNADPQPVGTFIPTVPILEMSVGELVAQKAEWNPRRISAHDLDQLEKSLRDFGCVQPIVWNRRTKTVIGGHQRLAVLARYGVETTPVSVVDLDPERERVLNVVLNRNGGEFDDEKLRALVEGLASSAPELLDGLGFTQEELRALESGAGGLDELEARASAPATPRARVDEDPPAPPEDPSATKAAITRAGDSWICGDHVVHCLDSTLPESLERLAKGPPADCVVTDPPLRDLRLELGPRGRRDGRPDRAAVLRAHGRRHRGSAAPRRPRLRLLRLEELAVDLGSDARDEALRPEPAGVGQGVERPRQ